MPSEVGAFGVRGDVEPWVRIGFLNGGLGDDMGRVPRGSEEGGAGCANFVPFGQAVRENLVGAVAVVAVYLLLNWVLDPAGRKGRPGAVYAGRPNTAVDTALGVLSALVWVWNAAYKVAKSRFIFMLAPCHVLSLMHAFVLLNRPLAALNRIFLFSMAWQYGAIMAILTPDTANLYMPGEVLEFWAQHWLITVIVPPYLIFSRRKENAAFLRNQPWEFLRGILSMQAYHWFVLGPVGRLLHANLNYMQCPPELVWDISEMGLHPLLNDTQGYRIVTSLIVTPLSAIVYIAYWVACYAAPALVLPAAPAATAAGAAGAARHTKKRR